MIRGRRKGGGAKALAALLILITVAPLALAPLNGPLLPLTRQVTLLDGATVVPHRPISNGQVSRGFPTHEAVNPATGGSGLVSSRGLAPGPDRAILTSPPTGLHFDYIVVLIMENHGICDILTTCGGGAPYMTSLANASGLATSYLDISDPSLPNYLGLTAATDFGCGGYDGLPHSNACTNLAWNATNLVDRFEGAGLTWKAYMEAMPANCTGSDSGTYLTRHNPFVYYKDIVNDPNRCDRDVPAGTSDATFLADLNSTANASNYMWLSPDKCNDMHSCSVAHGDGYLATLVPKILSSPIFTTQRAALYITYDEDGTSGAPHLYTVWAGPTAKPGYNSSAAYNHYAFVATLEANWNLPPLTLNDSAATPMNEFFIPGPTARFDVSPTWPAVNNTITFNGSASSAGGSNSTLQFRWDWTHDGVWDTAWSPTPTAQHAYDAAGLYTAALEVKDSIGSTNTTTRPVPVDGLPPTTIADLAGPPGLAGWFTGNVTVSLTATDDLSGVARTNDSVDGGAWQPYAAPVAVTGEGNHTLRFFSVDNATNQEATHTQAFEIDSVAPLTTPAFAGTVVGNVFVTPINVTLSATDSGSGVSVTRYRVDGGPFTNYSGTFTVSNVGSHNVSFGSTDVAGNAEPTNSFVVVDGVITGAVGLTSQATLGGTPGSSGWYVSSVSVNLTLVVGTSPPDSIFYRLDGGAWTLYSSPFFVMGDGVHGLDFNATNNAGLNEAVHHAAIPIDTTAPQTTAALSGTPGANGWYISTVMVNLTATDATSGVAGISFRIDGGPWTTFAGSFAIGDGVHALEYFATDVAGNVEATHTVTVFVDSSPPTTNSNVSGTQGNNGWYASNATVSLSSTDALSGVASITYRVDNGSWSAYSGVFELSEGRHQVDYFATDIAGNQEAPHGRSVSIDTTPPTTTLTLSGTLGADGWYTSNVTVAFAASDATSGVAMILYRVDGGGWQTYASPFLLGDGPHTLAYYAIDVAGVAEAIRSPAVKVDATPPTTEASLAGTVGSNGWYVSNVTVTLASTDGGSGVANGSWRVDGGAWQAYVGPFMLSEGRHSLEYRATDIAGNVEPIESMNAWIDSTPPTSSASLSGTAGNDGWYVSFVTVTLSATDALSGVSNISFRIDGGAWAPYAGPLTLGDGVHTVDYQARDIAGNVETVHSASVSIDTQPPTTTITLVGSLGANGWYVSNVTASLGATDPMSGVDAISYRIDNGSWQIYAVPILLGEGRHFVEYYATDLAGNSEAHQIRAVSIDTTPPVTSFELSGTPGNGGWYVSNVSLALNATDAMSGVAGLSVRVDNGSWTDYSSPLPVGAGRHRVEFFATDVAGIPSPVESVDVNVDTAAPSSTITVTGTLGDSGWYVSDATVTLSAIDDLSGVSGVLYRVDGGAWQAYTAPLVLSDGRHVIEAYATDVAGNVEPLRSASVAIDTSPPSTATSVLGTMGNVGWFISNATVSLASTDAISGVATISYRLDGGAWTIYTGPLTLGDGRHALQYRASDLAGNVEMVHAATFSIDTTPPVTTHTLSGTAGANGWYTSDASVTLAATDAVSGAWTTRYRLDGGSWTEYTGPISAAGSGRHVLDFASVDVAGNLEEVHMLVVNIDLTDPSFASLTAAQGSSPSAIRVSWTAFDNESAILAYFLSVDGTPYESVGTATSAFLNLTAGAHVIRVQATDGAGRTAVAQVSVTVEEAGLFSRFSALVPLALVGVGFVILGYAVSRLVRNRRKRP
ncbi:MAG TPA: alkaline phosphatase family protein [Thermoplasmata archaeon]|nr:alkaline phosphatase family protein [Thermoplasmata archaeon]